MAGNQSGKKKKVAAVQAESSFAFKNEVILLAFLAVSIILFLGNFGFAGGADTGGNWVSMRMRGLFGIMEYIFPILFFVSACFCLMGHSSRRKYRKVVVLWLMALVLGAVVQLLRGNEFEDLFEQGMNHVFSGGLLCGGIAKLLYSVVGFLGSLVILILIFVGCIIYLTELSFVNGVEKGSRRVYENTRQDMRRRRENHSKRREENAQEREKSAREQEEQLKAQRRRRQKEMEAKRQKEEKIARQMAYMEQDRQERENRAKKYKKKKYVNLDGRSIVTLEQPPKKGQVSSSTNDVHEIFSDETEEVFTIQRNGEVSEVKVNKNEPLEEEVQTRLAVKKRVAKEIVENDSEQADVGETKQTSMEKSFEDKAEQSVTKDISKTYEKPDLALLKRNTKQESESDEQLAQTGRKLQQTLQSFGVRVTMTNISCGPSVTRYELQPEQGVKVSKIVSLSDDIKLNLAVEDIRIEAPIPGKAAVGIEVPNKKASPVLLGDLLASEEFQKSSSPLSFAVGKDISGKVIVHDVAKMPHLLIAGATGSGKSVCINTLIMSILYKADPDKVKLIMVDPKVVELSVYNGIPHMYYPVVTDPKKAAGALNWAVAEMTERYNKMAVMGVRDVKGYNAKLKEIPDGEDKPPYLPQIVIIVDELADLMMVAKNEVEDAICRLAQLARAAGIHLVIATQRPSVDVITGLIKANMPSRIALAVSSGVDSRTIIDINGAEKLLGKGDMLFYPSGYPKPVRVQGAYISDGEVSDVVEAFKAQNPGEMVYSREIEEHMNQAQVLKADAKGEDSGSMYDEYFADAGKFVIEKDKGSIGALQRMFRIGFNRAARIMDQLEEAGVVGAEEGTKPRKILMSMEEFEQFVEEYV